MKPEERGSRHRAGHLHGPSADAVESAGAEDGPVTALIRQWLLDPDVLADPTQVEDGRVWTYARDLMPHVLPGRQETLVAAWEDATFVGRPHWDDESVEVLWLEPLVPAVGGDQVHAILRSHYDVDVLVHQAVATWLRSAQAPTAEHRTSARGHAARDVLTPVLEDLYLAVELLMDAHRGRRRFAQQLLRTLHRLHSLDRLMATEAGEALLRVARRTAPRTNLRQE